MSESLGVVPPWNLDSLDSILRRSSWVTWNVFSDILTFLGDGWRFVRFVAVEFAFGPVLAVMTGNLGRGRKVSCV